MSKLTALVMAVALSTPITIACARNTPKTNVGHRHPNLDSAQELVLKAFYKVEAAQKANEYDLDGHAAKAKEALRLASDELKLAAQAANRNK
jgi:hypothetical protein